MKLIDEYNDIFNDMDKEMCKDKINDFYEKVCDKLNKEKYADFIRSKKGKYKKFEEEFALLKMYVNSDLAPNGKYCHVCGNQSYDAKEIVDSQETKLEFCFLKEHETESRMLEEMREVEKDPDLYDESYFEASLINREKLLDKKSLFIHENKNYLTKKDKKRLKELNDIINPNYISTGIKGQYKVEIPIEMVLKKLRIAAEKKAEIEYEDNTKIIFGTQYDTKHLTPEQIERFKNEQIEVLKKIQFPPKREIIIIFIEFEKADVRKVK